ncbi:hypothetical protein ACP4OV_022219 [Aristida adscensionis]
MAAIREESDYDSSRSSLTVPGSGRSWISDIGSSSSVSVRSFGGGSGGGGGDTPAASCRHKPHKANQAEWEAIRRVRAAAGRVGLEHFRLVRRLGSGDLGNVYLCQLREPRPSSSAPAPACLYAMKVVDKDALAFRKKLRRAEVEREILRTLDHPFLPTLYADFEASHYACLVMEFCPGGDLHVARQRQPGRRFSVASARFYAAETVLALEYLHMMGVVYRDLKPENVLVRGDGHIMLSDFDLSLKCDVVPRLLRHNSLGGRAAADTGGRKPQPPPPSSSSCVPPIQPALSCLFNGVHKCHAKVAAPPPKPGEAAAAAANSDDESSPEPEPEVVVEPVSARSMSFVGTHEYLAPEVISGQGHGGAVDWWTLGVFMYEMIYGRTPFKGESNPKTLANILRQPLSFPRVAAASGREWDEHLRAQDLMAQLLAKNPKKRLGTCTGSAEVKKHDFFKGVNWALIRSVRPPEVPPKPASSPAPAPAPQKKVLAMSKKERQEPYNYRPDDRFDYF